MSIGTLKPSKAELEKANEVLKKAKAIKRKVVRLKQGDCIEYRALKEEIEKQKQKKNKPIERRTNNPKVYKFLNGKNRYLGYYKDPEIAKEMSILAERHKKEFKGNVGVFIKLLKSKLNN